MRPRPLRPQPLQLSPLQLEPLRLEPLQLVSRLSWCYHLLCPLMSHLPKRFPLGPKEPDPKLSKSATIPVPCLPDARYPLKRR